MRMLITDVAVRVGVSADENDSYTTEALSGYSEHSGQRLTTADPIP